MQQHPTGTRILAIQHADCENLGYFETVLRQLKIPFDYLDVSSGETFPLTLNNYTHLIVLGGFMSAYQEREYPWLRYECDLIEYALEREIGIVGICLGAQLIAKVLGASVQKGDRGSEIGWYDVVLTPDAQQDPLLKEFPHQFKALQWHGDTFDLPEKAVRLASSSKYENQAFRYGDRVWGLQFHLEVTEEIIQRWLVNHNQRHPVPQQIPPYPIQKATSKNLSEFQTMADRFIEQFIAVTTPVSQSS
ncbi:type 1 glutamine amidotransferase [Oxynema aestuarii]|jgi:GMP synthase (glutamine-hydrolysing)|uniref:Type 1 glutamine amidotransferase n=1 Tax=Oxynema aestuarii AP17 TaxID=2064643 RepID=A0A6H1TRU1_9CYAN|nr:type 1 glutamine amidotransferase [Oxynema aestuarii]QIZ69261.1 type 1 glutamine amidotransferase [Oxynema aestuarii AP17]RMH75821.1 MAG: type 1 glutamine amidotransferase [Cyanobacteria bacterium J007]